MSLDYPYYAADKTPVVQNKYADVYDGIRLSWLWKGNTRPSIFMPKWACRLWLKIKSVRVERVQEITSDGAVAEGCGGWREACGVLSDTEDYEQIQRECGVIKEFEKLWDSINKKRGFGWDMNPFVWVVEFERSNKQ